MPLASEVPNLNVCAPRWLLKPVPEGAAELAGEMELHPILAVLLAQRGLSTAEQIRDFLVPKLASLGDPFLLPEMKLAVDRILHAVDAGQKVALYGDYDVDGVTSMALMHLLLKAYGVQPHLFLPSRMDEGYGLSRDGFARLFEEFGKPDLLIALDCGTTSIGELEWLRDQGVDCVIVDHHELSPSGRPACVALVNPKLGTDYHYFCTAGLVFKVAHALLKTRRLEHFDLKETLDLVALGTVADLVPLVDENRLLVRRGLEALAETRRQGLRALKEIAGVDGFIQTHHVGFRLGPRLNAAGRLDTAATALQLLLAEDPAVAAQYAALLESHNRDRQAVELQVFNEAEELLRAMGDLADVPAIVLGSRKWHPGVVGIVASRISRLVHRPTILFSFDENGMGKGSGRSIGGFSLVEAIDICREHITRGGGHAMAAGVSVIEDKLEIFREVFCAAARRALDAQALMPVLELDVEIRLRDLSLDFLRNYRLLEPFGQRNNEPIFLCRRVTPRLPGRVMKEKHLRVVLSQDGASMEARWFNAPLHKLPPPPWDVAMRVQRNFYRGEEQWQLTLDAVRTAE
ncbi:MAG TPA: single-stranded-DNA-specific exonuclease RecJ [Prosthecobacter sp.]|nr:single-stranded-DNA-specific exonuclease RecJ [Prosthecobacter sp.]